MTVQYRKFDLRIFIGQPYNSHAAAVLNFLMCGEGTRIPSTFRTKKIRSQVKGSRKSQFRRRSPDSWVTHQVRGGAQMLAYPRFVNISAELALYSAIYPILILDATMEVEDPSYLEDSLCPSGGPPKAEEGDKGLLIRLICTNCVLPLK